jgi:hypothetical protein
MPSASVGLAFAVSIQVSIRALGARVEVDAHENQSKRTSVVCLDSQFVGERATDDCNNFWNSQ